MHIPDGFINAGTSLGAGILSAGGIGYSLRRAKDFLDDNRAPIAGLVAAFVFAVQMINFPVAAGTSGHLLGGVLAAVLLGPWLAAICIAVVLMVQAVVFADGGLSALGLNILNLSFIGVLGGWAIFLILRKVLPATPFGVTLAAGVAAGLSVPVAALGFVAEYAIGGAGSVPVASVATAMVGVHLLIGVGEGIITALTVGAVLASRPDLVYGATGIEPRIQLIPLTREEIAQ
ncbi:MAG: energy-coupling factor ABC transporter permease [Actinomycetota bacterium]